ncbi:16S rRNA (adenine(1518)-N(6)/adenine(1519)-N(6))-dimethyltransferase RsmA [Propionibacterium australiense]|uniref:Ribosomal RNA small subunit methyltransferase A n=1 Tax=Propionibacterium australiense TaxID=119981 RepID=A0A383S8V6_9ACTN|nr:16S rRNA (adenine(1518)-N(6)/adenine(1519)-N(6))-dimethyltransferase RsmA [Propionibacterium australiense]RLP09521.1 16S rRNA (adenine(1518)-N(6)/adenine(1519)-N(6))-dimethyltransferase RsmA [Propionibacterium australiense]RLP09899.1 16S rRNA (adenine(1518)-N(6)/adenine(1519)-N(6))-dimethyltransferase RsmA [Propionibacterium australiense]SYZ33809.1 16S rRNA (adenine1518-N6/adenine1519-N6)-dimethyltransferase [Propionibacterium australiense]VEH91935.1 Ribosomal RNA small subunit methyltransfe
MGALLDPRTIRGYAERIGLRPTKTLGQNFVVDANTVRRIVALSAVTGRDTVLEIGPGLGSLTLGLLETGARVTAVEIDPRLAGQLPATVAEHQPDAAGRLLVVTSDALDLTTVPGPAPTRLVANLPYNVAVPVLLHMLELSPSWQAGLVMVQLEVADRLVAAPGSRVYGAPSVKLAWYGTARRVGTVPPSVFWPVPKVDSGLVEFTRGEPPATSATRAQVFAVVDAAFAQRRKMLRAALARLAGSPAAAAAAIEAAGIDPTVRGERLDVAAFAAVAAELAAAGLLGPESSRGVHDGRGSSRARQEVQP